MWKGSSEERRLWSYVPTFPKNCASLLPDLPELCFTKSSGDGFVTDILTSERKDSEFRERHVLYNSSLVPSPTPSFSSLLSTLYRTKQRRKAGRGTGNEASIIPVS